MEQSSRIDLNHLHTFYWVAKSGSFTRAGKILALPKSSVSRQIAALEVKLGTRLIQRTTRRLALTEMGQLFFAQCERVMTEAEEAERSVVAYSSAPRGLLRVGVPVTFAHTFLAPILPAFCRKYPEIKLELLLRGERVDPVELRLDVVIYVGRPADSTYVVRKLGSVERGLFASQQYLKRCATPKKPAELASHSVISTHRSPKGARWRLTHEAGHEEEIMLDPRLSVPDPALAYRVAAGGLGIAVLPVFLNQGDGELVPVLPEWKPSSVEFFAVYPQRRLMSPKLRVFLDELESQLNL